MTDLVQELMTPHEAARWFRRSPSWLRQQPDLLRFMGSGGQPLYHVRVCRAYVLGKLLELDAERLRTMQVEALTAACGLFEGGSASDEMPQLAPPPKRPRPLPAP